MRIGFNGVGQSWALVLLIAAVWAGQALAGQRPEVASQVSANSEHAVYSDSSVSITYKVRSRDGEKIAVEFSARNEGAAPAIFQLTFSGASLRTNETQAMAMGGGIIPPGGVWRHSLTISTADLPFKARLTNIKLCDLSAVQAAPENTFVDPCSGVKSKSSAEFTLE